MFKFVWFPTYWSRSSQNLSEEQSTWVKQTRKRVMDILRETPPDGDSFAKSIEVC